MSFATAVKEAAQISVSCLGTAILLGTIMSQYVGEICCLTWGSIMALYLHTVVLDVALQTDQLCTARMSRQWQGACMSCIRTYRMYALCVRRELTGRMCPVLGGRKSWDFRNRQRIASGRKQGQ